MHADFGSYLADCIAAVGISREEFCRRVGYSPQNLHAVIKGVRKMPRKCLRPWLAALKGHVDADEFEELWLLTRTPELIRERYLVYRARYQKR